MLNSGNMEIIFMNKRIISLKVSEQIKCWTIHDEISRRLGIDLWHREYGPAIIFDTWRGIKNEYWIYGILQKDLFSYSTAILSYRKIREEIKNKALDKKAALL